MLTPRIWTKAIILSGGGLNPNVVYSKSPSISQVMDMSVPKALSYLHAVSTCLRHTKHFQRYAL
jgi:hypothetical protein